MERDLRELLSQRILVLDGAMGTMIQRIPLSEEDFRGQQFASHTIPLTGNFDVLSLTRPDIIGNVHRQYLEAGADIIETNTFSSTVIAQADFEMQNAVFEMNVAAAKIAKEAADIFSKKTPDKPRFVAGAIGPTNRTASLSPDVNNPGFRATTFDDLRIAYKQQAKGLITGGVDVLLIETIFDTLNAKAALFGIQELFEEESVDCPIMLSATITDASGRMLSGQTTEAFLVSVSHAPLLSVGLNCALGAAQLRPYLQLLKEQSPFFVSAHPNAGLPNALGLYDQSVEEMANQIEDYLREGLVNIVGGCCGTTPEHIQAIAEVCSKYSPSQRIASNVH